MHAPACCSRFKAASRLRVLVLIISLMAMPGIAAAADRNRAPESSWFVDMNRFARSAHAAFKCEECHATIATSGRPHPDPADPGFLKTPAVRAYDYGQCRRCHPVAYGRYLTGGHAEALAKEAARHAGQEAADTPRTPAPTCGDCHSSHYERSSQSRVEIGRRMVDTCGRCHSAHAASYLENIHGKAGVNLGNPQSAFCTDCHGAHSVSALKTPEAALPICRRCHPEAESEFTNVVIHASLDSAFGEDSPKKASIVWIRRVQIAAVAVVALSLIFFFGHTLLWLIRETHEKLRKR